MTPTPTPRTDAASIPAHAIRLPLLPSGQYDGKVTFIPSDFARQLERELDSSKDWNTAAFAATSIASATIARLESERDQLRKVCDDFANRIRNVRPIVREDGSREDWIDCQIDEMLRDYNSLPHVAKGETK